MRLTNAKAFSPLMDTRALIKRAGVTGGAPELAMASVSASNPYAENVGGAARAESWAVCWKCADKDDRNGPAKGSTIAFPDRPDLPRLYVQRCYRLGALFHAVCTANERAPA